MSDEVNYGRPMIRRSPTLLAMLIVLCLGAQAMAQAPNSWNQFRGPSGDGTSPLKGIPTEWSLAEGQPSQNIAWVRDLEGKAWSSPVVSGSQVWLSNATADGKQLSVVCLDLADGSVLLDQVVFEIEEPQFCIERNSYASSTPVISGDNIYLHYGAHGTACLDRSSFETKWTRTDLECDHFRGPGSSPIVWQDHLILTFDGADVQYLVALDAATGKTKWKTDRNFNYGTDNGDALKAYSTPVVVSWGDRMELISSSAASTAGYDPTTGKELWRVDSGGMNSGCRPVVRDGIAYVGTADGGFKFFAVRLGGTGDVTESHVEWTAAKGAPRYASPIVVHGKVYVGSEKGILTCLDAATGAKVWQERVGGLFMASPIFVDGHIYFFSEEGEGFVLNPGDKFDLVSKNKIEGRIMASPAVAPNCLLIRTASGLICVRDTEVNP